MFVYIHICIHTHIYRYIQTRSMYTTYVCVICPVEHSTGRVELEQSVTEEGTVGFHNFNLRIVNLRVSNPNKLMVDICSTRCRISMCQGLGPKTNTMKFRKSTVGSAAVLRHRRVRFCGRMWMWRCLYVSLSLSLYLSIYLSIFIYNCVYIYIYTHMCICIYIYIYIYIMICVYVCTQMDTHVVYM